MFFAFDSIPDQYKTQEICDIVVSLYPFLIIYPFLIMWDETVDDSLAAFKLNPDWFVTSKMVKTLYIALYTDDGWLFFWWRFWWCHILL